MPYQLHSSEAVNFALRYNTDMPMVRYNSRYFSVIDVHGGSMVSRVTIEVDVIVLSPTRDSFLQIDKPKVPERELTEFDANRRT